jgi:hypothetical protein
LTYRKTPSPDADRVLAERRHSPRGNLRSGAGRFAVLRWFPLALHHGIAVMSSRPMQSRRHERMLGLLIWLAFAALGIGILWWFSILSGD